MMPSGICAICFIPMFPFPHCLSPRLLFLPSSSFPSFSQLVPTLVFICVYPCLYVCAHVGICGCGHGHVSGTHSVCLEIRRQLWVVFHLALHLVWTSLLILLCFSSCCICQASWPMARGLSWLCLSSPPPQEKHCDCRWGLLHQAFLKAWYQGCFWVLVLVLTNQVLTYWVVFPAPQPQLYFHMYSIILFSASFKLFLPFKRSFLHTNTHIHTYNFNLGSDMKDGIFLNLSYFAYHDFHCIYFLTNVRISFFFMVA